MGFIGNAHARRIGCCNYLLGKVLRVYLMRFDTGLVFGCGIIHPMTEQCFFGSTFVQ
jgi:hypothetical protein